MKLEDYEWILLIMLTAVLVLILAIFTFNMVQSLNEIHFAAVKECVAMNEAANGTVCLV